MPAGDLDDKFSQFREHWQPKVVASLNGQEVKLAKILGEFPWHRHAEADELFLCWRGRFRLEFRDHAVEMGPGDYHLVPRGVEHRPVAEAEAEIVLFEPADVRNTGDVDDACFTAPQGVVL
ncbi:cupin domain-containing protein [Luteimonas vadosa]|uniref:Cupin domain-containing protein n=1 Tax=Luteimonas vadosa TaxID=1165507 RepID=A0ABP9DPK5_9GAMM